MSDRGPEKMDQTNLLWGLLVAKRFEAMKNLDPERIDFSRRHWMSGRTFLAQAAEHLLYMDEDEREEGLECIKRLLNWGASPEQTCANWATSSEIWKEDDKELTKVTLDASGHSAISYCETCILKFKAKLDESYESDWEDEIEVLGQVLDCFAMAASKEKVARVSIHEAVVELWEKQLAAKASHDLTFKTADGEVTAHAQMLKDASSVISAMLASPMKEGQAQTIEVKDACSSGVSLFLEMLVNYSSDIFVVQFMLYLKALKWILHDFAI